MALKFFQIVVIVLLVGCSTVSKRTQTLQSQSSIAILPFDNQSNHIEAPGKVRKALFDKLREREYRLVDLKKIDVQLKELGITDGGQLSAITHKQIGQKVPADLLCYGTVVEYGLKSAVAFTQRKVEIKLKLVETKTGKVIFEETETGITSRAGTDAAGDLVIHTAGKVVKSVKESAKKLLPGQALKKTADLTDEIADVDLKNETQEAIQKLIKQFPYAFKM